MPNVGEEIVGAHLKLCRGCDFVDYNVHTRDEQGEVDVIGINLADRVAYLCEVATHTRGLQYNRVGPDGRRVADNFERLLGKFKKDLRYARKYLAGFDHVFEFWSPVVREAREAAKYNPFQEVRRLSEALNREEGVKLNLVINQQYAERLNELRLKARETSRDVPIGVFRFLQIEAASGRYL